MRSRARNWRMITVELLSIAAVCAIFLQIGRVQCLQRGVQVLASIDPDAIVIDNHARKPLAELGIHILAEGAAGQLGPTWYLKVLEDQVTRAARVSVRQASDRKRA